MSNNKMSPLDLLATVDLRAREMVNQRRAELAREAEAKAAARAAENEKKEAAAKVPAEPQRSDTAAELDRLERELNAFAAGYNAGRTSNK